MQTQQTTAPAQGIEVSVRAMPAHGHKFRRRCGVSWTKEPRRARIVDNPKPVDVTSDDVLEFSPTQYKQLLEDPHIAVSTIGGADPEIPNIKAKLLEAEAEILKLRKQLADQSEEFAIERRAAARLNEEQAKQLVDLGNTIESLKADLTEKSGKRR